MIGLIMDKVINITNLLSLREEFRRKKFENKMTAGRFQTATL